MNVEFFDMDIELKAESEKKGRPVFGTQTCVRIFNLAGDTKTEIVNHASKMYQQRYPREYQAYLNSKDSEDVKGYRLTQWPAITRSQCLDLSHYKILTVEQLAEASLDVLANFGNEMYTLQEKARRTLSGETENEAKIRELEAKLAQATTKPEETVKRGPGRPPANKQDPNKDSSSGVEELQP